MDGTKKALTAWAAAQMNLAVSGTLNGLKEMFQDGRRAASGKIMVAHVCAVLCGVRQNANQNLRLQVVTHEQGENDRPFFSPEHYYDLLWSFCVTSHGYCFSSRQ